jgi:hypothetical protein
MLFIGYLIVSTLTIFKGSPSLPSAFSSLEPHEKISPRVVKTKVCCPPQQILYTLLEGRVLKPGKILGILDSYLSIGPVIYIFGYIINYRIDRIRRYHKDKHLAFFFLK